MYARIPRVIIASRLGVMPDRINVAPTVEGAARLRKFLCVHTNPPPLHANPITREYANYYRIHSKSDRVQIVRVLVSCLFYSNDLSISLTFRLSFFLSISFSLLYSILLSFSLSIAEIEPTRSSNYIRISATNDH